MEQTMENKDIPNKEYKYEAPLEEQKKPEHTIIYIFYNKESQGLALTDPEEVQPSVYVTDKELIKMVDWENVVNGPNAQQRYEFSTEIVNLKTIMVSREKFFNILHEYQEQLKTKTDIIIDVNELEKNIDDNNIVKSSIDSNDKNTFTLEDLLNDYDNSNNKYKK